MPYPGILASVSVENPKNPLFFPLLRAVWVPASQSLACNYGRQQTSRSHCGTIIRREPVRGSVRYPEAAGGAPR